MNRSLPAHIRTLRARNYRSLADITVELGPITTLIGRNGTGKSNVVDAIRFVRDALVRGLEAAVSERGGIRNIRHRSTGESGEIEIQLTFQGKTWNGIYGFVLKSERNENFRVKSETCVYNQGEGRSGKYIVENGKWIQAEGLFDWGERPPAQIEQTGLYLPLLFFQPALIAFLRKMGFYSITPGHLRAPQRPAKDDQLDEKGENLYSILRALKHDRASNDILQALREVTEGITDYSIKSAGGFLVAQLRHGDNGTLFNLEQESDGTLRMLGILTAIYQPEPKTLLAIEEPEQMLHPGALAVLSDVFNEASTRFQVLLTTHSPELLYSLPVESFRVVEIEDQITKIGPLAHRQREVIAKKLFSPGELMLIEGLIADPLEL